MSSAPLMLTIPAGESSTVKLCVRRDEEANVWWADSPNLDGLVVCGGTLDELRIEAEMAAAELMDLAATPGPDPRQS